MKVGIYLKDSLVPDSGGGYSYAYHLTRELINSSQGEIDYNVVVLSIFGKKARQKFDADKIISLGIVFTFLKAIKHLLNQFALTKYFFDSICETIVERKALRILNKLKSLNKLDLMYYPFQHYSISSDFPSIITNWDLGHLSLGFFPEYKEEFGYQEREKFLRNNIAKSALIFVESNAGRKEFLSYFPGYDHKVKVINMFPSELIRINLGLNEQKKILEQLNVQTKQFFFYPAQFWAHKNHYNLVKGFELFVKAGNSKTKLVLTGADKGNMHYIKNIVEKAGIEDNVIFPGFVLDHQIYALYKNAIALVMPTYLGPTNMPILEAMALGCPVICSDFEGHREMSQDCALFTNPDSFEDIANGMQKIHGDIELQESFSQGAMEHFKASEFNIDSAVKSINQYINEFDNKNKCWD